ncbi:PepSY domain-containing protein [Zhongshania arctica]|uniref:PepSY domain-containing protein n=1 Tax=Zhongshania arctica TaxID=3238302 RepID=A0ABV3TVQ7_9GAMM|tara:strand:- start:13252 stop:13578 length:327 start_codon:yes stop_codon:yes gene_type:complete
MKRTSQLCVQLQIVILLTATSFATLSEANPLGNVSGGRLSLPDRSPLEQRLDDRARSTLSVNEAISIAEQRYGGRAVGAKKIRGGNGDSYSVRILQDNGKIRNVIIND